MRDWLPCVAIGAEAIPLHAIDGELIGINSLRMILEIAYYNAEASDDSERGDSSSVAEGNRLCVL